MSLAALLDAQFKTPPYSHQLGEFESSVTATARALAWHMRTGKSKAVIDKACHLYRAGEVDGVLIFAPNGVHANWVLKEFPAHTWPGITVTPLIWRSTQTGSKGVKSVRAADRAAWEAERAAWWKTLDGAMFQPGLMVLAVNTESMTRKDVRKAVAKFVKQRRVMLVIDESDDFGTPGALRTKMARALARHCPYRMLLSGTMTTGSPLAAFSQFEILEKGALGFETYSEFKARYAIMEMQRVGNRELPKVVGFQNLEELRERMAPFTSVVLRSDCHDMPDLVPEVRAIDVTEEQRRVYFELKEELETDVGDAHLNFRELRNRLGKLQQVFGGFVLDQAKVAHAIPGENPRLDAIAEEVYLSPGKVIVWCEFQKDIDLVTQRILVGGHKVVAYHGRVSDKGKLQALRAFNEDGAVKALVGHCQSAGRGLDFSAAALMVWYSHTWKARLRAQALERATKIGGKNIRVVDFKAKAGPDSYILRTTQNRIDIGDDLTGRGLREVLRRFAE